MFSDNAMYEHPDYPIKNWMQAVANELTLDGYWAWVSKMERSAAYQVDKPKAILNEEDPYAQPGPLPLRKPDDETMWDTFGDEYE